MQHPARLLTYDELYAQLQEAVSVGQVKEHRGEENLHLYCYTDQTVYDSLWNPTTMIARGLILDVVAKEVVATPFPKFFNYQELSRLPENIQKTINVSDFISGPFEIFEKLDGSLIIIFYYNGQWKCATKGSLSSAQVHWAQKWLDSKDLSELIPGVTYLAEAIYPENRIVVHYGEKQGLVLLAAYDALGLEYSTERLFASAIKLGWYIAEIHLYNSIYELLLKSGELSSNEEGWIVRASSSGQRLEIKGSEYCRVHRLISGLTPLAMWKSMRDMEDLDLLRRSLPEEFWTDFDNIVELLRESLRQLLSRIDVLGESLRNLSDKEIGLQLHDLPADLRPFIFSYRKEEMDIIFGRSRARIFESFRPTRNELPGYLPSSSIVRAQENE